MQNYQGYFMNNGMYQQPMYQAMGLNGKVVDNFNMITANDVPMDNFGAIFVKVDGSEIQRKFWDRNGRIVTAVFKPDVDGNTNSQPNTESALEGVLKDINSKLDELIKGKKEGALNE